MIGLTVSFANGICRPFINDPEWPRERQLPDRANSMGSPAQLLDERLCVIGCTVQIGGETVYREKQA